MNRTKSIICTIALLIFSVSSYSQNLMEIIEKSEKTVFESRSYNKEGETIETAAGFFISANGLAITKSSIFENADSANVQLRNGRNYNITRVISVHPYTNLALIKVEPSRSRQFNYLFPSKISFKENEDLLTITKPIESDEEEGSYLTPITQIKYFPFISRSGVINQSFTSNTNGAPAINYKGELVGIINTLPKKPEKVVFNSYLLNDSNWIDINLPIKNIKLNPDLSVLFSPEISRGICNLIVDNYIDAAREFSKQINLISTDVEARCMRAYARYKYNNKVGSRDDFSECNKIDPHFFLQYYLKGLIDLEENKKNEAQINFTLCLDNNPNFAPAIVQQAMIDLERRDNIQEAYNRCTEAIFHDSLDATAFYQRSRIRFKYSDNKQNILDDINQTIYLNPNSPGIFTLRGIMRADNQDILGAIEDYDRALEKDPEDVHAYVNRGIAKYNIGLKEEACQDWNKAGELGNYEVYKYISRYCKEVDKSIYPN
nr:trypsin-like peptidase domain-containing protein [uncultured Carboxylicivirga sp.]